MQYSYVPATSGSAGRHSHGSTLGVQLGFLNTVAPLHVKEN